MSAKTGSGNRIKPRFLKGYRTHIGACPGQKIRISWGPDTDRNEVLKNFAELLKIAKQIKG